MRETHDPELLALPDTHQRSVTLEDGLAFLSRIVVDGSGNIGAPQTEMRLDDGRITRISVTSPLRLRHPFVSAELRAR